MSTKALLLLLIQDCFRFIIILLSLAGYAYLRAGRPLDPVAFSIFLGCIAMFLGCIAMFWFIARIVKTFTLAAYSDPNKLRNLLSDFKSSKLSHQIRAASLLRNILGDRIGVGPKNQTEWIQLWTRWLELHIDHLMWSDTLKAYIDHRLVEEEKSP